MSFIAIFVALVVGLGIGYAVGWNEALHPGKIKAQIDKLRGKD